MTAFEVFISGHRVCLAGLENGDGVLSVIVNSVPARDGADGLFFSVGGLDSTTEEFIDWETPGIGVGSEISIKIVDASKVDPPDTRTKNVVPPPIEQYRQTLRELLAAVTASEKDALLKELIAELEG